MSSVILQPSGSAGAQSHYVNTVAKTFPIIECRQHVSEELYASLLRAHPGGTAAMWGVTPGQKDINKNKWAKIQSGDVALFAADSKIYSSAVVAMKFHSRELATRLWGVDETGATWEYMYSLDEVRNLDISYKDFNRTVGYKEKFVVRDFRVLDQEKSTAFLDFFDLHSERHIEDVSDEKFVEAISNLDGPLERQVKGWARTEQSKARKRLLRGRSNGTCRLCAREMSAEYLVAAHIKRRTSCSDTEKRDIDNVMMLCCKFGCDELFEHGYLSINRDGVIVKTAKKSDAVADEYAAAFVGKKIEILPGQIDYFLWHFTERFLV